MINHLLTSTQMASFIADGYFHFDNIVFLSPCKTCLKEISQFNGYLSVGMPFEETWPKDTALGEIFRIPIVMGLIRSLAGPNPLYDHHGPHLINAGELKGPDTHQDSVTDFRENYFDIQLSFFLKTLLMKKVEHFLSPVLTFATFVHLKLTFISICVAKLAWCAQPEQFLFGIRGFGTGLGPTESKVQDICTN